LCRFFFAQILYFWLRSQNLYLCQVGILNVIKLDFMGKGDIKTKKGKRRAGSYGVSRPKKSNKDNPEAEKPKKAAPKKKKSSSKKASTSTKKAASKKTTTTKKKSTTTKKKTTKKESD